MDVPAPARLASLVATLLAVAFTPSADAQTVRAVEVGTDNDAYTFWTPDTRADADYTHGMWVATDLDAAPGWGRLAGGRPACRAATAAPAEGCLSTRLVLGQKLFTPRVDDMDPVPGERPYAGWLSLAATARVSAERVRREVGVELGVTGEPSLGEAVHTAFHRAVGFWEPAGWRNQVGFEPGVVLRYGEGWLVAERRAGEVRVAELVPEWGVAAGNVLTGAHAGARARLGWRLPHPWDAAPRGPGASVYVLAAARGEWVGRSIFLDGNTFGDPGVSVERHPWVGQYEVGVGVRAGPVAAELTGTTRGRDYRTQPKPHSYATISVRWERAGAK